MLEALPCKQTFAKTLNKTGTAFLYDLSVRDYYSSNISNKKKSHHLSLLHTNLNMHEKTSIIVHHVIRSCPCLMSFFHPNLFDIYAILHSKMKIQRMCLLQYLHLVGRFITILTLLTITILYNSNFIVCIDKPF